MTLPKKRESRRKENESQAREQREREQLQLRLTLRVDNLLFPGPPLTFAHHANVGELTGIEHDVAASDDERQRFQAETDGDDTRITLFSSVSQVKDRTR